MNRTVAVVRLHSNRRFSSLALPPILSVGIVCLMVVVVVSIRVAGNSTVSPDVVDGLRSNGGIVFSLAALLVGLGIQAATACFAFATSLGTTRRDYVLGTGAYFLLQSLYVAAILSILLAVEKGTGHWFTGAYALDVKLLGDGNWAAFLPLVLTGPLAMQAVGAMFGASWLRFGSRGPLLIAAVMVMLLAAGILIVLPRWVAVMTGFSFASVALMLLIVGVVALLATGAFLRRTSVRGT